MPNDAMDEDTKDEIPMPTNFVKELSYSAILEGDYKPTEMQIPLGVMISVPLYSSAIADSFLQPLLSERF